jgi:hypothetical protein
MSTLPGPQQSKLQRKNTLRIFYLIVVLTAGTFTAAVKASQVVQEALFALGIVLAGGGTWSFLRFLKVADTHQRLINHEATSLPLLAPYSSLSLLASCNDSGSSLEPHS